jgi:hypothetical protein
MHDREERRIASLEAKVIRLEVILVQLLTLLETSGAAVERTMHMHTMLQQMHLSPDTSMEAIRQALLSGDTLKAITLYRRVYGGSLKEAEAALGLLPSFR